MQTERIYPLAKILKENGEEHTQAFLKHSFECDKNPDIKRFLLNSAVRFEKARLARTFLILNRSFDILAYFTLSFKTIHVQTSKSRLKKLTGGLTNSEQINVFLIGQIGKNSAVADNPVNLAFILQQIFYQIEQAQMLVGGRCVVLECEDNDKLLALYASQGFSQIDTLDEVDSLKTLYFIPEFS